MFVRCFVVVLCLCLCVCVAVQYIQWFATLRFALRAVSWMFFLSEFQNHSIELESKPPVQCVKFLSAIPILMSNGFFYAVFLKRGILMWIEIPNHK